MSLQPNSVVAGAPIISTAGRLDNSQITDWYAWFFEPISYTDGIDDSQITDWYAYFFEPITYASTELTQAHDLSSVGFTSSSPEIQSTSVTENYSVVADNILVGLPIIGTSGLTEDYNLLTANLATGPSEVASSSLTQAHSISVLAVLSGQVVISTAGLIQAHSFQANDLTTGQSEATDPAFTQNNNLSADSVTTTQADVPSATMAEAETFSTANLVVGIPEVNTTSLTQVHDLVITDVVTGQTEVSEVTFTQDYLLATNSFVTGNSEVSDVALSENESFTVANIVTDTPEVNTTSLTQVYVLSAENILTPLPDLGEPVDPNAIVVQEIKEIEQMFGGWPRRAYEVPDGRLVQAEREIEASTGDRVSIDRKAKSLIKFGKSADLTADTLETVWTVGGNETYVTDNTIEYISSSSAADTQTIKLECHTVSGTGTDAKFTFLVQEVTLDGQNPVALDTPVARVSHAYNANGTEIVGRVTVYENTTVVGGVPSDATKIHIDIPQGLQGSFKGATTFSDSDYYVLTGGFGSVSKKQDANVDFYLEVREAGGVFIQRAAVSASTGGPWDIDLDPAVIVPKNADVRIRADSGTNNAVVFGVFKGYLAKVLN
jgi:hypothetical protein